LKDKKIVFLTGTRADFGKLKSLITILDKELDFDVHLFVTGMHLLKKYGATVDEIVKCGFDNVYRFDNSTSEKSMDLTLAKTIEGLSAFITKKKPDMIVVHGDRVEALAGAIVGSLNNILVSHIEGGEVSGTIDELIRHAVTKMSHLHFVANKEARTRLIQLGEKKDSIYEIGSPDIDIMLSNKLPELKDVKEHYDLTFDEYSILMFHPVTTEFEYVEIQSKNVVEAVIESGKKYVVIYPNNDLGSDKILKSYEALSRNSNFKIFPSIRFEYFLVLLKNAQFIIGNSSAGIREAPYYNLPTINIGTRQNNRAVAKSIINTDYTVESILNSIHLLKEYEDNMNVNFGKGKSDELFFEIVHSERFWENSKQKVFVDLD
tara:strand:- start:5020 stop:6147 length:1128 start_codon:yes stop_codon:yes gene_type:complete